MKTRRIILSIVGLTLFAFGVYFYTVKIPFMNMTSGVKYLLAIMGALGGPYLLYVGVKGKDSEVYKATLEESPFLAFFIIFVIILISKIGQISFSEHFGKILLGVLVVIGIEISYSIRWDFPFFKFLT